MQIELASQNPPGKQEQDPRCCHGFSQWSLFAMQCKTGAVVHISWVAARASESPLIARHTRQRSLVWYGATGLADARDPLAVLLRSKLNPFCHADPPP